MFWNRFRQALFAAGTVAGVLWPGYFIVNFIVGTQSAGGSTSLPGFDVVAFVELAWANAASGFVAADLAIVLVLAITFMITEGRRLKLKFWGLYIALIFLISFAFAFSLFMFVRERKLAESLKAAEAQLEAAAT
ncbi:MAG: DUF2834 domain-containing protein [Cyanobacteria bacterium P01_H01_bin.15]